MPETKHYDQLYIDGAWVPAGGEKSIPVIDPSAKQEIATVRSASLADVDRAVLAARRAFETFGRTSVEERIDLLERLLAAYERRREEFAETLTAEMGAPIALARTAQTALGVGHLQCAIDALKRLENVERRGTSEIVYEPTGVAALITPWNWPINQVFTKVASALAAGCTVVLKPSQVTPLDSILFAELVEEVGVPAGAFNLIFGDGSVVGSHLVQSELVDVVSFTGSTRAGREISKDAAGTIKTVHLELGGKSPNVILDDADLERAVETGVQVCFSNAGQSCSVATRMIVPRALLPQVEEIAKRTAESYTVGDPADEATTMGPVASRRQFETVQHYIEKGIEEGQTLLTGGPGSPEGLEHGYYVHPTIFTDVDPNSTIAQEEIFGPVLVIIAYDTEDEAVEIANGTIYGLAAVVQSSDEDRARRVASRIRAGHVYINHDAAAYASVPFGGWKQSGTGYEHDEWGLRGFQSIKAVLGVGS